MEERDRTCAALCSGEIECGLCQRREDGRAGLENAGSVAGGSGLRE